jgi:two-component system, chemotaxis family, protein-glutamate methylesterase/glutaminase
MKAIRVLVVDDSQSMRTALVSLLGEEKDLHVVGQAKDGVEAVQKARALRPDVITMDLNMPQLDGLGATAAIMAESPSRVLVVCEVSQHHQLDLSFRAMAAGALEVLPKPRAGAKELRLFGHRVAEAVRLMAEVPVVRRHRSAHSGVGLKPHPPGVRAIGIVASTGGPPALAVVLRSLPGELSAPVLVAQHIAAGFTAGLVRWLSGVSPLRIQTAEQGTKTRAGHCYLAPDDCDLEIDADGVLSTPRSGTVHCPSGNRLLQSLARAYGSRAVGIVLTGMGDDGAQGLLAVRNAGGATFAQDEESCVVFGMPHAARACGATDTLLPLGAIGPLLVDLCGKQS